MHECSTDGGSQAMVWEEEEEGEEEEGRSGRGGGSDGKADRTPTNRCKAMTPLPQISNCQKVVTDEGSRRSSVTTLVNRATDETVTSRYTTSGHDDPLTCPLFLT